MTVRDLLKATGLPTHHHRAVWGRVTVISHDTPGAAGMLRQLAHRGRRCPYGLCEPGQTYTMHTSQGDRPATGRARDWYWPSRARVVAALQRKKKKKREAA